MAQRTLSVPINGMHCAGCEVVITTALEALPGIVTVSADHIAKKVQDDVVFFQEPVWIEPHVDVVYPKD